ncbi:hypothetical protein LJY25_16070 [Hymenobacter sp. BT175]|uniref:hypothetical protein n=1 Tax=Hymenobacter translucens TaxID=2886507 RepID=UPI001D0DD866|nr:hypothetical protein [Hymenobacter translucens]MCC2547966.1 hypothetical protein [Hymenobacter translucens]
MRSILIGSTLLAFMLTTGCSEAQSEKGGKGGKKDKDKKESLEDQLTEAAVPGLRRIGSLSGGVSESSGLARAETAGTFYTHADAGNAPVLYKIDMTGRLLEKSTLPFPNTDWEDLAQDDKGTLFVIDAGNNNNTRRDLAIYRVTPGSQEIGKIIFAYPDQKAFPPSKKQRNFDCEAALWHGGRIYLFTKDRANHSTSKVYSLSDKAGEQQPRLLASLTIPGEVTGADVSSDGRRIVLLAQEALFVLEGGSFEAALKAAPRRVSLKGAGQTEGIVFRKDDNSTLYISTEQGTLYEYKL